ncbi:MAG: hypothetical protein JNL24_01725 [Bacteroidia bacterium]|nr:hypothetical protein [Bacteroidia bacterium]
MKLISTSFLLLSILLISSCSENPVATEDSHLFTSIDTTGSIIIKKYDTQDIIANIDTAHKIVLFKTKMNVTTHDSIISAAVIKSKNDHPSNWTPPKKGEIISIIKNFYELNGYDWNTCYGDLGYGLEGELFFENRIYKYHLDAGGWIIIYDHKTQRYFGCKGKDCNSNFPSNCFCDENGIIDE